MIRSCASNSAVLDAPAVPGASAAAGIAEGVRRGNPLKALNTAAGVGGPSLRLSPGRESCTLGELNRYKETDRLTTGHPAAIIYAEIVDNRQSLRSGR